MFLAVCYAIANVGWLGGIFSSLAGDLRIVVTGVFLYSLGWYIRQYDPFGRIPVFAIIGLIIFIYITIWVSYYNTTMYNIETYIVNESVDPFAQAPGGYADYSIIPVTLGICLFEIARRIKMPNSRIINYLSAASFMVYLLHDDNFMYMVWRERDWMYMLYYEPKIFCMKLVKWTVAVYMVGVLVYSSYRVLDGVIQHLRVMQEEKKQG